MGRRAAGGLGARWLRGALLAVLALAWIAAALGGSPLGAKAARAPYFSMKSRFVTQFFSVYRTSGEVFAFMKHLTLVRKNCTTTLLKIGSSVENRPILLLRISGRGLSRTGPLYVRRAVGRSNPVPGAMTDSSSASSSGTPDAESSTTPRKLRVIRVAPGDVLTRGLLLTSGAHGREWITIMSTLYVAGKLVELYGNDPHVTRLLDHATVHIAPILNPDGYHFTWQTKGNAAMNSRYRLGTNTGIKPPRPALPSRLWRSNRRRLGNGAWGVDLNRNWGHDGLNWGMGVKKTTSLNFQGESGFSEPETQTIRNYVARRQDLNAFVDVHCCTHSIRAPFSLLPYNEEDALKYAKVGVAMALGMERVAGLTHRYEFRPKKRQKFTSGLSSGWSYSELGWEISYTVELGGHFVTPASALPRKGEELWAAVMVALTEAASTLASPLPRLLPRNVVGPDVAAWQRFLSSRGLIPPKYKPGNVFGPVCTRATGEFQARMGLKRTGILDHHTLREALTNHSFAPHMRIMSPPCCGGRNEFVQRDGAISVSTVNAFRRCPALRSFTVQASRAGVEWSASMSSSSGAGAGGGEDDEGDEEDGDDEEEEEEEEDEEDDEREDGAKGGGSQGKKRVESSEKTSKTSDETSSLLSDEATAMENEATTTTTEEELDDGERRAIQAFEEGDKEVQAVLSFAAQELDKTGGEGEDQENRDEGSEGDISSSTTTTGGDLAMPEEAEIIMVDGEEFEEAHGNNSGWRSVQRSVRLLFIASLLVSLGFFARTRRVLIQARCGKLVQEYNRAIRSNEDRTLVALTVVTGIAAASAMGRLVFLAATAS